MKTSVDVARQALEESVEDDSFGDHLETLTDAPGLLTETFVCQMAGYVGWYWAVSLSVLDDQCTVNDIVLLPGEGAIVAPEWMPYRERVRADDLSPGDVLPPDEDDIRLVPAWSAGDGDSTGVVDRHFAREIGLGREWVLSIEGREDAADRWYDSDRGPESLFAKQAPSKCVSCGFLVSLAGDLADRFGVCANRFSPADGQIVALNFGCGAHSEARPRRSASARTLPEPVFDTVSADDLEEI